MKMNLNCASHQRSQHMKVSRSRGDRLIRFEHFTVLERGQGGLEFLPLCEREAGGSHAGQSPSLGNAGRTRSGGGTDARAGDRRREGDGRRCSVSHSPPRDRHLIRSLAVGSALPLTLPMRPTIHPASRCAGWLKWRAHLSRVSALSHSARTVAGWLKRHANLRAVFSL